MSYYCFNVGDVGFDPVNLRHWLDGKLTLAQRLRRCLTLTKTGFSCHSTAAKTCHVERVARLRLAVYSVKGNGPTLNRCSSCEHVIAVFYLLISHSLIPWTLSALSQRWSNVMWATSACGVHTIRVTYCDRTTGHLPNDSTLSSPKSDDGGGHLNGRT